MDGLVEFGFKVHRGMKSARAAHTIKATPCAGILIKKSFKFRSHKTESCSSSENFAKRLKPVLNSTRQVA
jgi:hypothetical protein